MSEEARMIIDVFLFAWVLIFVVGCIVAVVKIVIEEIKGAKKNEHF